MSQLIPSFFFHKNYKKIIYLVFSFLFVFFFFFKFTVQETHATLFIASSTPARVTTGNAATTASFTPSNNSLLLATVDADTGSGENVTVTMTNNGTALTWTQIAEEDSGTAGAQSGFAAAWYALLPVSRALTVTATTGGNSPANPTVSLKVYVVTGHSTTSPIGASGKGQSTTNNITPTAYTSTVDGSLGFGTANDWNALGTPASTDRADAFDQSTFISGLSVYKNASTTASGTAVTMNFDGAGAGAAAWNWVGFEVLPERVYKQSAYRFFKNTNSADVGTTLEAQDTPATLGSAGAAFRLRMLVYASSTLAVNQETFKLQYVGRGSGTCANPTNGTPSTYTDVSASTVIAFNNNPTPADAVALTANANDPTHGSDGIVNQTYVESNPVNNTSAVASGRDGNWDFSLIDNSPALKTASSSIYCFRMATTTPNNSVTGLFSKYDVYPQITTATGTTFTATSSITANARDGVSGGTSCTDEELDAVPFAASDTNDYIGDAGIGCSASPWWQTGMQFSVTGPIAGDTINLASTTFRSGSFQGANISGGEQLLISVVDTASSTAYNAADVHTLANHQRPYVGTTTMYTIPTASGTCGVTASTLCPATGNMAGLLQKVIDQPRWQSRNFIAMVATTSGAANWAANEYFSISDFSSGASNAASFVFTYTAPTTTQNTFRWYDNANAIQPTAAEAAENATTTLTSTSSPIRLRINTTAGSLAQIATSTKYFTVQYATDTSGPWTSVGASTTASAVWRFYLNSSAADGATTTSALLTDSNALALESYSGSTTTVPIQNTIKGGQTGEWDFALEPKNAVDATNYYFRMYNVTDNAALTSYTRYPGVTIAIVANPTYTQRNYRWFLNTNNVQPGSPKSSLNATTTDVDNGNLHRLRMDVAIAATNLAANGQIFDLQYRAASTGCDTTGTWTNVGGATSTDIWIMYDNPGVADAATLTTALLNSSNVLQNYNETTTFINPTAITSGQAAEWDWGIVNNGATAGTTYCFRIAKTGGTALDAYTNYPKLTVSTVTGGRGGGSSTGASTPPETISTGAKAPGAGTTTDPVVPSETPTTGGTKSSGGGDSAFTPAILKSLANLIEGLLSFVRSLGNG